MTLLPPNASKLQQDLEKVNAIDPKLIEIVEQIKSVKSEPPKEFLYWLIWEYGLEELMPYISDLNQIISDGLLWQRKRGTPESLKMALAWIDYEDTKIEEEPPGLYFYQYQLKLKKIPTKAQVNNIQSVCKLSSPVRSRLSRLYNEEHDIRKLSLSQNGFGYLLSDYSGVKYNDLKLSFGHKNETIQLKIPTLKKILFRKRYYPKHVSYYGNYHLGYQKFGDVPATRFVSSHTRIVSSHVMQKESKPLIITSNWLGNWNNKTWDNYGIINIAKAKSVKATAICFKYHDFKSNTIISHKRLKISEYGKIKNNMIITSRKTQNSRNNNKQKLTQWLGPWTKQTWKNTSCILKYGSKQSKKSIQLTYNNVVVHSSNK